MSLSLLRMFLSSRVFYFSKKKFFPFLFSLDYHRYIVTYLPRHPGKYQIKVDFMGTFGGVAGPLRGTGTYVRAITVIYINMCPW